MKIHSAEFVAGAYALDQLLVDKLPQIVLAGSSNVGKSSLINQLGRSPKLAMTSSTPGKTGSVNYYRFNKAFYLVDLPGYGYAKVSDAIRQGWVALIEGYLTDNEHLVGSILVVDLRHPAKPDDIGFFEWAKASGTPLIVLANKADKLTKSQQHANRKRLAQDLGIEAEAIIPFSASHGLGRDTLLRALDTMLAPSAQRVSP